MADPSLPTRDRPDDDPRLWLEEVDGADALTWVEARNAETLAAFGGARFEADRDALAALLDRPDRIPYVTRRNGALYNFWQDADRPRGVWRRTTLESFRSDAPVWETVLDVDALAARDGEAWVWRGARGRPGGARVMVSLSRGGGDAAVLREFDLETRDFAPNGFHLPEAKGGCDWWDDDTLIISSAHGEGMTTRAGYARAVRRLTRGQTLDAAPILFETSADSEMGVFAGVDRTGAADRIWFVDKLDFYDAAYWLGDADGPKTQLDLPRDVEITPFGDWVALRRRSAWTVDGVAHPAGALLGGALAGLRGDASDLTALFTPEPRRALQDFRWVGPRLLVSILDDLRPLFELHAPSAAGWRRTPSPGGPPHGVAYAWPLDSDPEKSDGAILVNAEDPVTPATLSLVAADAPEGPAAPEILKRAPAAFDTSGLRVTRHEAIASDGARIPYTQTGPDAETGDAPVYLTGYGGFEIPILPRYQISLGALWLARGGVGVTAHIRGGGEFGRPWHEAGRRAGKSRSHDDFAAVAADLVARGVTRPDRIAAEGGSNGGLLIANMLTRHPEKFGALFCTIPLVDMRRYSKLLAGASWVAEYGDPDVPEDWAFLQDVSAYHAAAPGRAYPPILIATTRRDDRVHPGHARKFAAKLQELGYQACFYEPSAGGHGFGTTNKERASFTALGLGFLREMLERPAGG